MAETTLFSKFFSSLTAKRSHQPQSVPAVQAHRTPVPTLKILFFIVDWHHANTVSNVFVEENVRFHFTCKGRGTANSEILDLLGIGANDKAVIICLEQAVGIPILMKEVRKKLKPRAGTGIAFSIPLSAINDPVLLIFKQSIHKNEKIAADNAGGIMANEFSHDLILSIVNKGFSDELMNTARAAGATGGTVINARGQAHEGAVKFFGVSVQDEKEIVIIVTSKEQKVAIMRAISEAHGLNSEAQAIVFSLPVDDVLGLSFE